MLHRVQELIVPLRGTSDRIEITWGRGGSGGEEGNYRDINERGGAREVNDSQERSFVYSPRLKELTFTYWEFKLLMSFLARAFLNATPQLKYSCRYVTAD